MIKNRSYYVVFTLLVTILVLSSQFVRAQDNGNALAYGQTVKGEITDKAFEVNYTFKGDAADLIIIQMARDGYTGGLDEPAILVLDSTGKVVADTTKAFSLSTMVLPVQLTAKGDYTVVATRQDGRAGKSVGKYTLSLLKPDKLVQDKPIQGKASYGLLQDIVTVDNYYLIEATGTFQLLYQKQSGEFAPEVSVNIIKDNELQSVASLSGDELSNGTIGISAQPNAFYIVKVGHPLLAFSEGEAQYTITLTAKNES